MVLPSPYPANMGLVAARLRASSSCCATARPPRRAAGLRRGDHRLPRRPGRRAGADRRPARPDDHGQGRRRRAARGGVRRLGRADGADRARRRRLPGGDAVREPAGGGRGARALRLLDDDAYAAPERDHDVSPGRRLARPPATAPCRSQHTTGLVTRLLLRRTPSTTTRGRKACDSEAHAAWCRALSPAACTPRRRSSRPGSRRWRTRPSTSPRTVEAAAAAFAEIG